VTTSAMKSGPKFQGAIAILMICFSFRSHAKEKDDSYKSPNKDDSYKLIEIGNKYKPSGQYDSYKSSGKYDSYKTPYKYDSYKTPDKDDSYKSSEKDDSYKSPDNYELSDMPSTAVCFRDEDDHLPTHLAKVLEFPQKYIIGPFSEMKGKEMEVVIVGGGISGLTSAYLLLNAGHKVTILEASNRIGGRIHTERRDGWYADLGAMRFPQYHRVVQKALKLFKIPTAKFTNYNEGSEGNYFFINNKYILNEDLDKQETLRYLYKTFQIPEEKIPKDKDGKIRSPNEIISEILANEVQDGKRCRHDITLHNFLRKECDKQDLHNNIPILWSILTTSSSFLSYSVDEFLSDSDENQLEKKFQGLPYDEIINGASVLPETIFDKIKSMQKFAYYLNTPVWKIDNSQKSRSVVYFDKRDPKKSISADMVIMATTAPAVNFIKFTKPLPYWKRIALDRLKYANANKVFMKFKTAFWSKSSNNKAKPILYGDPKDFPNKRLGGTGITDNHLEQIYYPSNTYHGTSLLVSYTWDNNADMWLSMNDSTIIETVLEELELIHGPVVREEYEDTIIKKWNLDEFSHGAFVMLEPFQKYNFKESLSASVDNIRFVGEYTHKFYNGWVESAMESSISSMVNLAPQKFDEHFHEEEMQFFTRAGRQLRRKHRRF